MSFKKIDTSIRNRLIESTLELLDKKPVAQINYREIAAGAGVSHMTAYRHFKSMPDLFEAVAEEGYKHLANALSECMKQHQAAPHEILEKFFLTYFYFAQSNPHHLSAMFDRGDMKGVYKRASFLEAVQGLLEEYLGIIRICQNAEILPRNQNENDLGLMLWSFSHGYAFLETKAELKLVMHSRPTPEAFAKRAVRMFIAGVNA